MDKHDIALLDLVDHPVFALEQDADLNPRYVAFNAFALSIVGIPLDAILGRTAAELYQGHLGETAFRHHKKVFLTGVAQSYEILLPIGAEQALVRTSLRPIKNAAGRVVRLIGSSVKVPTETPVTPAQTKLDEQRREMQEFVNLAAHDLRTPIRNIGVIAGLLREGFQDQGDGKLELIDMLDDVSNKASSLIDDVLHQADFGSAAEQETTFGFGDLVREIMGLLDPVGQIGFDVSECGIRADRRAVRIILRSLVDGAIKQGQQETDVISNLWLVFAVSAPSSGRVEFSLEDNMRKFDDVDAILRGGRSLKTAGGFGLLGVRRMLNARDGELVAENLPNGPGARVGFTVSGQIASVKAGLVASS